ncbi:transcriptional regulator [Liquorilactobacillus capillatus DSM 19910]|uniref:Transcriptional regulator n=2 Tax=Liquorilactobacillus capillatus TaxID=480931 RepID=A0A0R1M8B1_9LACO|nr:transcriptional regulator [Liquorilactobacillus capillatus DSM 19910]
MTITRQSFLVFMNQIEERPDNTFETLKLLSEEENVTAGRIAEVLDIKPSSVTQIIKKLEKAGTVKRIKSEQDARITFVKLTAIGRETLNTRGNLSTGLKEEMFKGFSDTELKDLSGYLDRLGENLTSDSFEKKVAKTFGDDRHWRHFAQMSARFGHAREKMLDRHNFEHYHNFSNCDGFNHEDFRGFDRWKRGHDK